MSEVKRFSVGVDGVDPNGNLVRYVDYVALKQRAEAAEAKVKSAEKHADNGWYLAEMLEAERDSLQAKLTGLEKQEPYGWVNPLVDDTVSKEYGWAGYTTPLFTRPAPAINLAELVPDVEENESAFLAGLNALVDCLDDCGDADQGLRLALRASRTEILRNIEEQSQ